MAKDKTQEIKKRLRELRKEKGLYQEDVAEKLHSDRTNISKWESPKNNVLPDSITYYEGLADVYGVSIDYIMCRDNTRSVENEKISQMTGLSEHAIEVLKALKGKSGKGDGVMTYGDGYDNYSWKNVEMINYIFESVDIDTAKEKKVIIRTILYALYEYIHISDYQYIHSDLDTDKLTGFAPLKNLIDLKCEYDKVKIFDWSTMGIIWEEPTKLFRGSYMSNIQKWLLDEAEKHEKKEGND